MTATYVFRPVDILYKKERFNSSRITYDPEDITLKTDVRRCVNIHTAQLVLITWKRLRKLANISTGVALYSWFHTQLHVECRNHATLDWIPKHMRVPAYPGWTLRGRKFNPAKAIHGTYIGLYDTWKGCKLLPHRRTLLKNDQVNVSIGP